MEYTKLDHIIRRALARNNLTLHLYIPFLIFGRDIIRDLHWHHLPSAKTVPLTIVDGLADLPEDCTQVTEVGILINDKLKPLTPTLKLFPGDKANLEQQGDERLGPDKELRYFPGIDWEKGTEFTDGYRVLMKEGKIRFDKRLNQQGGVYLTYITSPKPVNNQSLVTPLAEGVITAYMVWQWALSNPSNRFDPQSKERMYGNELRLFRATQRPLTGRERTRSQRAS